MSEKKSFKSNIIVHPTYNLSLIIIDYFIYSQNNEI